VALFHTARATCQWWEGEAGEQGVRGRLTCWKMARLASTDGGFHVELLALRHRSDSEARMLMHTVRLSGWSGELVLKLFASARCCSVVCASAWVPTAVPVAASMDSAGMVSCQLRRERWKWDLLKRDRLKRARVQVATPHGLLQLLRQITGLGADGHRSGVLLTRACLKGTSPAI
jgi:hypothetical protein